MGMSIEDIVQGLKETYMICCSVFAYDRKKYIDGAIDRLNKYQMMQADYETRLKADIVAMLTEILLEAEENTVRWYVGRVDGKSDDVVLMETLQEIIQERIDKLKGDEE